MTIFGQLDEAGKATRLSDRPLAEAAQANLAMLGALLSAESRDDSFIGLFEALREVFSYDQAMVLEFHGDALECAASVPGELQGRRAKPSI
jgi:hypothetical protein